MGNPYGSEGRRSAFGNRLAQRHSLGAYVDSRGGQRICVGRNRVGQVAAQLARLDRDHCLSRRHAGYGPVFLFAGKAQFDCRFFCWWSHHSILGCRREPVRRQYQFNQLHRHPRESVRDQLAIPDQQSGRRRGINVCRGLDRAAVAQAESDVGVPVSGDALSPGDTHAGECAIHCRSDRQPHERHPVPSVVGNCDHDRHRCHLEHPDHGRIHHDLYRAWWHESRRLD